MHGSGTPNRQLCILFGSTRLDLRLIYIFFCRATRGSLYSHVDRSKLVSSALVHSALAPSALVFSTKKLSPSDVSKTARERSEWWKFFRDLESRLEFSAAVQFCSWLFRNALWTCTFEPVRSESNILLFLLILEVWFKRNHKRDF